jgi:hypothetical protein
MRLSEKDIDLMDSYSKEFKKIFKFYLEAFDSLILLQSNFKIETEEFDKLNDGEQNSIKAYVLLMETSNTTMTGVLRLLSGNLYSDAYSLLRILYETVCLMKFGNLNEENKELIVNTFFKSKLQGSEQNFAENNLEKLAIKKVEELYPGLNQFKYFLNNFGSHISRDKIALGNVGILGDSQASKIFSNNFNNKYYLSALDILLNLSISILEEYIKLFQNYRKFDKDIIDNFIKIKSGHTEKIRPQLLKMIKEN